MSFSSSTEAFEAAKKEFLRESDHAAGIDLSSFTTIHDVYDTTDKIQQDQSNSKALRYLQRIQPYLTCINHYAAIIETFAQAKPEFISPIWGGVKAILLIASTYVRSYDKILEAMEQLGNALPDFEKYTEVFHDSDRIKQVLALFYKDILDFHSTVLKFFRIKNWRFFLESLWPKYHGRLELILRNIAKSKAMMDSTVTLMDITKAHQARIDAYRKYERDYEFQQRQDFEAAKQSLSPNLYYKELENATERCSVDSGKQIRRLDEFKLWCDPGKSDSRLLWLQGIPGAGKTCLSSSIISQLRNENKPVAFLMLSYHLRSEGSLLKLLHSMIFQFAIINKDLRQLVYNAYNDKLDQFSSSVEFSTMLLRSLLQQLGLAYIIVDGLDEIAEINRPRILGALLELHDAHDDLKLLISSRAEHDILRMLESRVKPIRMHNENGESIKEYVAKRSHQWLSTLPFNQDKKNKIKALMEKIAPNAQGMFLYARLVCGNLESQGSLAKIEKEVTNLPSGLYEAYDRVLRRIEEDLRPQERKQAKEILEWVSCCYSPVSNSEILLALECREGDPSQGCSDLILNIFQRCGSIIEEVDGFVHFVHFTAREYLFSPESRQYLKEGESHARIATTCLRYLGSSCFDPDTPLDVVEERVLNGAYVLENYACLYWLDHVKRSEGAATEELADTIQAFLAIRRNSSFGVDRHSQPPFDPELKRFQKGHPDLYTDLMAVSDFWRRRKRELCFQNERTLFAADPLTTSVTQIHIRATFEQLLCSTTKHNPGCNCSILHDVYGSKFYRCSRPGCARFRRGFQTRKERERHLKVHNRPFKCNVANCDFSTLGFWNRMQLQNHLGTIHKKHMGMTAVDTAELTQQDEAKDILIDAIQSENQDLVRTLEKEVWTCLSDCLMACLQQPTSPAMVELLLSMCDPILPDDEMYPIENAALQLASPEYLKLLLQHHTVATPKHSFRVAASTRSPEMFRFLATIQPNLKAFSVDDCNRFFKCIIPNKPDVTAEAATLECLEIIKDKFGERDLGLCLIFLAKRCQSKSIATFCLENRADLEASLPMTSKNFTPLWYASSSDTREAAGFMKVLLTYGARSDRRHGKILLGDRPGPRNISKWFGMEWDDFVKDCQK